MRISSLFLSILLHLAVLAFILYVPLRPPLDITRPVYQVSLVMGAPGGENLPSPVLGARAPVTGKQVVSTESAPRPKAEPAPAPAPDEAPAPAVEVRHESKPEPRPEPKPEPKPEPQKDPVQIPQKPEPRPEKKPEPKPEKKPDPKPEKKPEPKAEKKPEPKTEKKTDAKASSKKDSKASKSSDSGKDALADALADVRKQARSNSSGKGGGTSASRALADLEKQVGRTGVGGGGGEGDGPGGGGIYDVYAAQVILAVQPNWSMPTYSRNNIVVQVRIKLDKQGRVLDCHIERSSGRPEFDASAVNAIIRTKTLPPPPTPAQQDLVISFNSLQMMGR
ncbi:cell envelope integrity protein TolA [uncultured Mailhella sp.]|uniref:cell envelope integrity protein TolA n=1 Tax=uncultured Mailhella sp. TaxID=1981031 RepID=UPI0025D75D79|nr:cell envelope integrity protein TolA [uncultured Mailhella sp.]